MRQVPYGMTLERMALLAIDVLVRDPAGIGFVLTPRRANIFPSVDSSTAMDSVGTVPFVKLRSLNNASRELDSSSVAYSWNLPRGHAQNDILESLEAIFFFAMTRNHLISNGRRVDFEQSKIAKASLTLPPFSESAIAEYRAQELVRYNAPETAFTFTCSHPLPGFLAKTIAMPNLKSNPGRKGALLKDNRPEKVTNASLVRDALSRLPGGVGTRSDIATLVLQSQFIAPGITEIASIGPIMSSTLDRLHLEYDSGVRYDADLRLYIYLHRQRTVEQFIQISQLAERAKKGDTSELWAALHATTDEHTQPSSASLQHLLQSNSTM